MGATRWDLSAALGGRIVGTADQWRQSGLSEKRLKLLVASGGLVRVRRGCYATKEILAKAGSDARLDHAIKVAALMAASRRRDCVASHHSAARIHGLELLYPPGDGVITITIEPGRKTGRPQETDVVRHAAKLPEEHITEFRGLLVTTVARTVADLARTSTFAQGVVVADSAMRSDPSLRPKIRAVLQGCPRWPGADMARRVAEFASWVPETPLESAARAVFHELGLPPPLFQAPIIGIDGKLAARTDFCWPEYGVIAEADGAEKYRLRGDFKEHHQRDSRLWAVGWEVVHFMWDELFADPAGVVSRIRFAFERGQDPAAVRRRAQFPQAVAPPTLKPKTLGQFQQRVAVPPRRIREDRAGRPAVMNRILHGELVVVIDCGDLDRAARFWTAVLGYTADAADKDEGAYRSLYPRESQGIEILLQRTADAKVAKNRLHLDLRTRDLNQEVDRVTALGAAVLTDAPVREHGWTWHVLGDPDGNEFCVLRPPDEYWASR